MPESLLKQLPENCACCGAKIDRSCPLPLCECEMIERCHDCKKCREHCQCEEFVDMNLFLQRWSEANPEAFDTI